MHTIVIAPTTVAAYGPRDAPIDGAVMMARRNMAEAPASVASSIWMLFSESALGSTLLETVLRYRLDCIAATHGEITYNRHDSCVSMYREEKTDSKEKSVRYIASHQRPLIPHWVRPTSRLLRNLAPRDMGFAHYIVYLLKDTSVILQAIVLDFAIPCNETTSATAGRVMLRRNPLFTLVVSFPESTTSVRSHWYRCLRSALQEIDGTPVV